MTKLTELSTGDKIKDEDGWVKIVHDDGSKKGLYILTYGGKEGREYLVGRVNADGNLTGIIKL